ncbi:MAG: ABC transporter substrate-binding protein [Anaerolineaceae bacterium]|nr:ABC transporter substrate-binding protein [Anaerolineaceae bacterium]
MFKKSALLSMTLIVVFLATMVGCAPAEAPTAEVIEVERQVEVTKIVEVEGEKEIITETITEIVTATPAAEVEVDKYGGTFYWGMPDEFPGFNPVMNDAYVELYLFGMNAEPLTWGGENYPTILEPILAESWEVSEDGKVWTIHLREGVLWHDGVEFTSEDVVFWAEAIQHPDTEKTEWLKPRFSSGGVDHKFEAIDKYTVQVTTEEVVSSMLNLICVPLFPKHLVEDVEFLDLASHPSNTDGNMGTGPFKMIEYKRGEAVILEAFEDHWRGKPYLDGMVLREITDPQAMVAAVKNGEVDWARVDPSVVPQLLGVEGIEIEIIKMDSWRGLHINNKKPFFADKRIRQAMMYGLDRQAIVDTYLMGYGSIPDFPFTYAVDAYKNFGGLPQYEHDPAKALELLAEVGWEMGADGVLVANGVEGVADGTRFEDILNAYPTVASIATVIQSNLAEIGMDLTIEIMEWSVWTGENLAVEDKPYSLMISGGGWLGSDASGYSWAYFAGAAKDSHDNYFNQEVQDLFDQSMAEPDRDKSAEYIYELSQILWDELPLLPLAWASWIFAKSERLHIEEAGLDPALFAMFTYPEKIWVEK